MKYFSGFLFENEAELFSDYIPKSDGVVAGFSYGAIKAFEYAYSSGKRVERLILLSPSFFEDKNESYIKKQLKYYESASYKESFFSNVAYPSDVDLSSYYHPHSKEDLETLLRHQWDSEKLKDLVKCGITIEVFLGAKDRIINASKVNTFFSEFAITYLIKESGHSLQL
ncbi:MAG: pimelyl-ACP methyl ester esterase BioV [Campylobacterota bacterium]|nr:pimelyl-ACP methyl ester esterase BioV [Campylobacterota bacterium]